MGAVHVEGEVMANEKRDKQAQTAGVNRQADESLCDQDPGRTGMMANDFSRSKFTNTSAEEEPHLSPALQGHLGRQLRAAYSELVHEPMPDKFAKLLEELSTAQAKKPEQK